MAARLLLAEIIISAESLWVWTGITAAILAIASSLVWLFRGFKSWIKGLFISSNETLELRLDSLDNKVDNLDNKVNRLSLKHNALTVWIEDTFSVNIK